MFIRTRLAWCLAIALTALPVFSAGSADEPPKKTSAGTASKPKPPTKESTKPTETDKEATKKPEKVVKSAAEWRKQLTPMQYKVARLKSTEAAFSGEY